MKKFVSVLIAFMLVIAVAMPILAGEYEISDIAVYKALPKYHEPPELRAAVARGEFPPVEQRLPKEPRIVQTKFQTDGIGVYGGAWRSFQAGYNLVGWNWGAGVTAGWWGVNANVFEPLLRTAAIYLLKSPEPLPNLAKSYEWSEDGRTLTIHLLEGAKWSDGVEFTSDDIVFSYEDLILDPHVPSLTSADTWTVGGKVAKIEKVDDYTFRWHFGAPFPLYLLYQFHPYKFTPSPKHVLEKFHPKYNSDATYESFINCLPPERLPVVTLGPWVPVIYKPDEILVARRNPYYWQVDEAGNQLPYLSEYTWELGRAGVTRTLNLIGGTCDHTHLERAGVFSFALEEAQREDAPFRIDFGPFGMSFDMNLNFSLYQGVKTDRDRAMRELFRNLNFRKALSYGIDREEIATAIFPGPMVKPHAGGLPSGGLYYDPDSVVTYSYDPEKSKVLLSELGFSDTDGNGIVNWPAGSLLDGQDLSIVLITSTALTEAMAIGEGLIPMLRNVGIKLILKVLTAPVFNAKIDAGEVEATIAREDKRCTPFNILTDLGAVTFSTPVWHKAGPGGKRDLLPFEVQIKNLLEEVKTEPSMKRRSEIFSEVNHLWTKNLYTIGTYEVRMGLGVAKRFNNIPEGVPPHVFEYFETGCLPYQVWTPEEEQRKEMFPGLIPSYKE